MISEPKPTLTLERIEERRAKIKHELDILAREKRELFDKLNEVEESLEELVDDEHALGEELLMLALAEKQLKGDVVESCPTRGEGNSDEYVGNSDEYVGNSDEYVGNSDEGPGA